MFDLNGQYASVEKGMSVLKALVPDASIEITGDPLAFPMNHSDEQLRAFIGDYGQMPLEAGIKATYESFQSLISRQKPDANQLL